MNIKQVQLVKTVLYYNNELQIPINHKYVATDRNGDVFSYSECPSQWADSWFFKSGECTFVATASLTDANKLWKSSCQSFDF